MEGNEAERRRYPRKELFLVMEVEDGSRTAHKLNVITNNISAGGVYFKTPYAEGLEVGMAMDFTIFLSSPTPKGKAHPARIEGKGRIVRQDVLPDASEDEVQQPWRGIALEFARPLKVL